MKLSSFDAGETCLNADLPGLQPDYPVVAARNGRARVPCVAPTAHAPASAVGCSVVVSLARHRCRTHGRPGIEAVEPRCKMRAALAKGR
jgi:hypothetical protein